MQGSKWLIICGRPASPKLSLPDVPVLRSSGIGANCITIMNAMLSVSKPYTVHMHMGGVGLSTRRLSQLVGHLGTKF